MTDINLKTKSIIKLLIENEGEKSLRPCVR